MNMPLNIARFTRNMPQLFISHYQDYDTFDISNLFYNVTGLDEKLIVVLFDDNFDLVLEANMEKDKFCIKVKSTQTNETTHCGTCVSISFYCSISDTIHKKNVKKMFYNWSNIIFHSYESLINHYNEQTQNQINVMLKMS